MGDDTNNAKGATDASAPAKDEPEKVELAQNSPFQTADSLLRDSQLLQANQTRLLADAQSKVGQPPENQLGQLQQDPVKSLFEMLLAQNRITDLPAGTAKTPGLGSLQIDISVPPAFLCYQPLQHK